jgi:(1->4)-alpha-D-glucan 1-alpha-D-glucosylmutase
MKRIPLATYRLQFNPTFGFVEAAKIVSYLSELGISCLYASPIFKARNGSAHGYDIVDPNQLNPELGTVEEYDALVEAVEHEGMMWLQDIVPNHMAFDAQNQILIDVLENGPHSKYFGFFDVEWDHPYGGIKGRVLAPFLGRFFGECLESGEIHLRYGQEGFTINYYDFKLPVRIESYATILTHRLSALRTKLGSKDPDFIKFLGVLGVLYGLRTASLEKGSSERYDQISLVKVLLWELYTGNADIRAFLDRNLRVFNGKPGAQGQKHLLEDLLREQLFRLSFWKVATEEINYRRFFIINELISLRMEDPEVFDHCHTLIFKLISEGKISGLRVDHVDGLHDPTLYLHSIRARAGEIYTVVEKILAVDERIPTFWPIAGTTGYDFMNVLNGIFCEQKNEKAFDRIYAKQAGFTSSYAELVASRKQFIAEKRMAGDVDNLAHLIKNISSRYREGSDLTLLGLKRAIVLTLAHFPVYRTYLSQEGSRPEDRLYVKEAVAKAKAQHPEQVHELEFIENLLLQEFVHELNTRERNEWLRVVMKFQQLSGPLMAKGLEDTVMYIYNRLISLNEVGGSPNRFGVCLKAFHGFNEERARNHPHTMNATSTHDVKRGEDVRARLNILSEIPHEWERAVRTWRKFNRKHKKPVNGILVPEPNDEYFLYQTLVGAFPFSEGNEQDFSERIKAYILKAVREAKMVTSWLKPDEDYERACLAFVEAILDPGDDNLFLKSFLPFQKMVAAYGIWNSLSQVLIKIASPGIPDFYQGTELWDLHLVDPDNRRPVDFSTRQAILREVNARMETPQELAAELLAARTDGRVKLYLICQALRVRKNFALVFSQGSYLPLRTGGVWAHHVLAFCRKHRHSWVLAVAPRFLTRMVKPDEIPIGDRIWRDTHLLCRKTMPSSWINLMTGESIPGSLQLPVGEVLRDFPVALLIDADSHTGFPSWS